MRHALIPILALAAIPLLATPRANAAQSYDNCSGFIDSVPATLTTQGVWCLRADLSTAISSGAAITIANNNVTLDCNDFKLGGLAAGASTGTTGVYAENRLNAVVRNCNIRGFFEGIHFAGGSGHVAENSRFEANRWIGIRLNSENSLLRGNLIMDTGGSSVVGEAYGIVVGFNGADVVDNIVAGVAPGSPGSPVYGIWLFNFPFANVRNNRVHGLVGSGATLVAAIYSFQPNGAVIEGNVVHGPNNAGSVGISCFSNAGTARGNTIRRFNTPVANCTQLDNLSNNN